MTDTEIIATLERAGEGLVRNRLVDAVRIEAIALRGGAAGYPNTRSGAEAVENYTREIQSFLDEPRALSPRAILMHRREAVAWAVAEVLREYGHGVQVKS